MSRLKSAMNCILFTIMSTNDTLMKRAAGRNKLVLFVESNRIGAKIFIY